MAHGKSFEYHEELLNEPALLGKLSAKLSAKPSRHSGFDAFGRLKPNPVPLPAQVALPRKTRVQGLLLLSRIMPLPRRTAIYFALPLIIP